MADTKPMLAEPRPADISSMIRKIHKPESELRPLLHWFFAFPEWLQALILVFLYLLIGTFVLCGIEDGWSYLDGLYFCVVTLTTVGYGDKVPVTDGGRLFVILYGFIGVAMIASALGNLVDGMFDRQQDLVAAALTPPPGECPRQKEEHELNRGVWGQIIRDHRVWYSVGVFVLSLTVGTIFYTFDNEGSDRFVDSFYIACTTSTTVGYGDLHPEGDAQKWFTIFWMILMCASMGRVVGVVTDVRIQISARTLEKALLYTQFDPHNLQDADFDHDGRVSRYEYLRLMLVKLDKVEDEVMAEIMDRFDEIDKAATQLPDGYITQEDVDSQLGRHG
eukprot:TRINITY_DN5452_c0_g1_i3.p1 TRINITY_DN5452_c0_g1~~TRINITY_DN5452_c0_g1_i3.p1  ORF type:complete len:334 (+),score=68.29 TRINITY_DN5452_c0_g1_i3:129-1130(+)